MNELQKTLESFAPGDLWLHGTPTAHLNTTFLLNCAAYWSRHGRIVTVLSSEMRPDALHAKTPTNRNDGNILYRATGDWSALLEGTLYIPAHDNCVVIVDQIAGFVYQSSFGETNYYEALRKTLERLLVVLERRGTSLMIGMSLRRSTNLLDRAEIVEEAKNEERYPFDYATITTVGYHERPSREHRDPPLHLTAVRMRKQKPFEVALATNMQNHWIDLCGTGWS